MCADAAKNDYLTLRNHCVQGERGNVPIFEKLWRIRSQAKHSTREALLSEAGFEKLFRTQNWVRRSKLFCR